MALNIVPSFSGLERGEQIWVSMAAAGTGDRAHLADEMAAAGLLEDSRVAEAGAVWWNYHCALVADNNRMYHRIGWIGRWQLDQREPGRGDMVRGGVWPGQAKGRG